jgi:hypothetical protein
MLQIKLQIMLLDQENLIELTYYLKQSAQEC